LSAVTSEDDALVDTGASRVGTTLLGKYTLDRVLGVGGMGVVYAATHRNGKRFALKLLHPVYSSRRDIRTRFLREGYVANAVNHPGVVAVLDDDVAEDGSAFLVMELLDGSTVEALGARPGACISMQAALGIAEQLLGVLDCAHARSIVHRDIKPANLFVLRDGQVKVLDFGLARLRDAATGLNTTRTGETMGTPAFMPPEQARGEVNRIDARSDIWAVGATLFTAVTGRLVHEGENARQVMVRAATQPARLLSSVLPDAPDSVVQLLAKALDFDKSARWACAAAMREAVAQAYIELYGALSREHLQTLFTPVTDSFANAPTELSPQPNTIPTLDSSAVVSGSVSVPPPVQPHPTSHRAPATSRAKPASRQRRGRFVAGAVAVTLFAVVIAIVTWRTHRASKFDAPASEPSELVPIRHHRASDPVVRDETVPDSTTVGSERAPPQTVPLKRKPQHKSQGPAAATTNQPSATAPLSVVPVAAVSGAPNGESADAAGRNSDAIVKKTRRFDDAIDHQ
jgi:serine/threonine-protein kinase